MCLLRLGRRARCQGETLTMSRDTFIKTDDYEMELEYSRQISSWRDHLPDAAASAQSQRTRSLHELVCSATATPLSMLY